MMTMKMTNRIKIRMIQMVAQRSQPTAANLPQEMAMDRRCAHREHCIT